MLALAYEPSTYIPEALFIFKLISVTNNFLRNFFYCLYFPFAVCFLLGNSPASEFHMPTIRYTLFLLHMRACTYPQMKIEQTECTESLAYGIQTPRNYPEESIEHSEHGENLK